VSINPLSLPPILTTDYYVPPSIPVDHRFTCPKCDVTWREEAEVSACWCCGEQIDKWKVL
jgi:hypothetical protein